MQNPALNGRGIGWNDEGTKGGKAASGTTGTNGITGRAGTEGRQVRDDTAGQEGLEGLESEEGPDAAEVGAGRWRNAFAESFLTEVCPRDPCLGGFAKRVEPENLGERIADKICEEVDLFKVGTQWYADLDLCQELMEQGNLELAKRWLTKLHHQQPDSFDVQTLLLDVLFKEGLSERNFEWIEEPSVVRLNRFTRDRVYSWIRTQGGFADVVELRYMVFWEEYLCFEEEALVKDLRKDDRFRIVDDGVGWILETRDPVV